MIITSGTGSEYSAGVDSNNRLSVFSIAQERVADVSARTAESFIIASDFVALTNTGSFNAINYLKNTSNKSFYIQRIRVCSFGSGHLQVILVRNPTAGTIVSEANAPIHYSANLGSNEVFSNFGVSYVAAGDSKTLTDGAQFSNFINHSPGHSIQEYGGAIILTKGASFGLSVKPSAAMTVCTEIQGWFE